MATNPFRQLDVIKKVSKQGKSVTDCYRLLYHKSLWIHAYKRLSQHKSTGQNQTERNKLKSNHLQQINAIIKQIKTNSFRFIDKRKCQKSINKREEAVKNIAFKNQIVLEMIKLLLEYVYQPILPKYSYGNGEEQNIHHALKEIKYNWGEYTWCLHGHITNLSNHIESRILLQSLSKKISDPRFLSLIHNAFISGYINGLHKNRTSFNSQYPQTLLELLQNIYLYEFDLFIEKQIRNHRQQHPLQREKSIQYIRYDATYIIGISGSRAEGLKMQRNIQDFLNKNFELKASNLSVTHLNQKLIFLDYEIQKSKKPVETNQCFKGICSPPLVQINIPSYKLKQFALQYQYGNLDKFQATPRKKLLNQSEMQILQRYNQELAALANHYKLASNRHKLNKLFYIARCSFISTIAKKRKSTYKKVVISLKKYKKDCLILQGYDSIGKEIHEQFIQLKDIQTIKSKC